MWVLMWHAHAQWNASDKFGKTLDPATVGDLNKLFKRIASCCNPDIFEALSEELRTKSPDYYAYVFESGFPPSTWANRGGQPFTTFNVRTDNPAGERSVPPCLPSSCTSLATEHRISVHGSYVIEYVLCTAFGSPSPPTPLQHVWTLENRAILVFKRRYQGQFIHS